MLDSVKVIIENLDSDTVAISADHGEAFGEYGVYRHPGGIPHPQIKRVPWITISATDSGSYIPTIEQFDVKRDVEEHLANLGYA